MIPGVNVSIRNFITWLSLLMMFAGFLVSRAVLSIGTILFFLNVLLQNNWKERWIFFRTHTKQWLFTFLFFIPALTFFWSADKTEWSLIIEDKIPLLLFPLAFAAPIFKTKKEMIWLSSLFILLIAISTVWSVSYYMMYSNEFLQVYYKGELIRTPSSGDYIRFSWGICIAILLALKLLTDQSITISKTWRIIYIIIISWLVIYLHILGSKTGVLGLYLVGFIFFAAKIYQGKTKRVYITLLMLLFVAPFIAYTTLPTFKLRAAYVHKDFDHYSKDEYAQGFSDATRINSIKASWGIFKNNPAIGVGFGDIKKASIAWYNQNTPWVDEKEKIFPSGEIFMYGCGAGLIGVLGLLIIVLRPFFQRKQSLIFYCFHALCVFTFLYEPNLDTQYGVFLYGFFSFLIPDNGWNTVIL